METPLPEKIKVYHHIDERKYIASIWLVRKHFYAEGKTKEEAILKLKEHLRNLIPIYENTIEITQELLLKIKEVVDVGGENQNI